MLARQMDDIVVMWAYVIVGSPDEVAEQLREVAVKLPTGQGASMNGEAILGSFDEVSFKRLRAATPTTRLPKSVA